MRLSSSAAMPRPGSAIPRLVTAILGLSALARAVNITVPSTIQAGVETEITVGFDTWKTPMTWIKPDHFLADPEPKCLKPTTDTCSLDGKYEHYQLFLWTEEFMYICKSRPKQSTRHSCCSRLTTNNTHIEGYLSGLLPIPAHPNATANPLITIPKDLGPSVDYSITVKEFNGSRAYDNFDGGAQSDAFQLEGSDIAGRQWSLWERYGGWVKPQRDVPCSSYACWRDCGEKFSDGRGNTLNGTAAQRFDCWKGCPGVVFDTKDPSWDWLCHSDPICDQGVANTPTATATRAVVQTAARTTAGGRAGETAKGENGVDKREVSWVLRVVIVLMMVIGLGW